MTSFWLIGGAMLVVAAAAVLIPIWFAHTRNDLSQSEINTRIFRERLTDLENDLQQQRIDQTQYQQLRVELERNLLIDVPRDSSQQGKNNASSARWLGSGIVLLVLVLASVYYYKASYQGEAQQWIILQEQLAETVNRAIRHPEQLPEEALEDLPNFTRVLQAKVLRDGMNDPDSLLLLGVSLMQLQVSDRAQEILHRAHRLAPKRTDIMMAYAQTMILNNEGKLTATSASMLHTVLQAEPNHQGALMMLGFGAFNSGNYDIALKAWKPLLASIEPDSEAAKMLQSSIARAEQMLAHPPVQPKTSDNNTDNNTTATEQTAARIDVTIELSPELNEKLDTQDTLFIFAKAASGPPMPLAAVRQQVSSFPIQVILDDSKAMMPSMKLSNFQEVVVGARISKAGDVMAKPGDLEGLSKPLSLADGPLSVLLMIDQVVQ